MVIIQLLLAVILISLELGPLGRASTSLSMPALTVVATWAYTWFADQKTGLRWAIITGLIFDLVGFLPFGTWLVALVSSCLLTDLLKSRFFEVSSTALSLVTLVLVSAVSLTFISLMSGSFDLLTLAGSVVANGIVGLILYYALALRFRFFQRWTGRRL